MTAMAAAAAVIVATAPRSKHRNHCRLASASPSPAAIPSRCSFGHARLNLSFLSSPLRRVSSSVETSVAAASSPSGSSFHGPCYVVGDNIDTDQIIPAQYLTLVPSKPDEYRKLGSYALIGLPTGSYPVPFIEAGLDTTRFPIIIAGANFGCGSSREHAPVALGAAGVRAVVAESYARIFFRNSIATGEVYPVEADGEGLWRGCSTGDIVTVDISENTLINHSTGKEYMLKPMGDLGPVIDAGGIFAYARQTGMIPSAEAS